MCLAKAFWNKDEETEPIMEDVTFLEVKGNTIHLRTLFGEIEKIEGTLKQVDFQGARIIIESKS